MIERQIVTLPEHENVQALMSKHIYIVRCFKGSIFVADKYPVQAALSIVQSVFHILVETGS